MGESHVSGGQEEMAEGRKKEGKVKEGERKRDERERERGRNFKNGKW